MICSRFIMDSMPKSDTSILFLGKADDPDCTRALAFCQEHFTGVTYCLGVWGDPLPEAARAWEARPKSLLQFPPGFA